MPELTTLNIVLAYLGFTYLVGAVWFLVIERKDGFLKWRIIASALAPLTVLLIPLAYGVLHAIHKTSIKLANRRAKRTAAAAKEGAV